MIGSSTSEIDHCDILMYFYPGVDWFFKPALAK